MMNIQPGRTQCRRRTTTQKSNASDGVFGNWITAVCKAGFLIGVIGLFFYLYISMNQQITLTDKAIQGTLNEIVRANREIDAQRNRLASLQRAEHIRAQINRFHLPLSSAKYSQQRRLNVLTPQEAARVTLPRPGVRIAGRQQKFSGTRSDN